MAPDVEIPAAMRRGVANSADEVRQRVREILGNGADFIKVIATGAVFTAGTTPSAPEFTESEIRAAVEEAANKGTFVVAHAHSAEGIKRAVRAGVRSVEHASYLDDEGIELMRRSGTWLVADIYNGDYTEEVGSRTGWSAEIMRKNRETTDVQREAFVMHYVEGKPLDALHAHSSDRDVAKLVERLLASAQYGQRWGRNWLDAAG